MALSTIPFSGLGADASNQGVNFRNLIINGDMSIAQRGTSTASITSSNFHSLDRYQTVISSLGTWTQSQSTDVPTGQGFAKSLKMDCTTADASPSASDYLFIRQMLEGQMLQHLKKGTSNAESLTVSFWVKSVKTGTYIVELFDNDNGRLTSKSYTVSSASTWEKKTITFDADTTGTLDNDNADSFQLRFWLGAGTTYTSGSLATTWEAQTNANRAVGQVNLADSTSNEWYITGVQLEVGTSATPFEFIPYDVNLERCYRYFQRYTSSERVAGFVGNSDAVFTQNMLRKDMRSQPTISVSGVLSFDEYYVSGRTQSASDLRRNSGSTMSVICIAGNFSSMTRSNAGGLYNANMDMDSEL